MSENTISPTELVEIPSGGKYYPLDHPLYNKNTIEIKYMTTREEDLLSNSSLIKKGVEIGFCERTDLCAVTQNKEVFVDGFEVFF